MILLSRVEDVFEIEGRGCVLTPGVSDSAPKDVVVHRGDPIELRKPDGSIVQTRVQDIEFLDRLDRMRCSIAFLLPTDLRKSDVPIGTEVWLRST